MSAFLHYEVHDGTGPYLLMVHGMLSSRAQWRPNIEPLGAFCRPVVIELWGHGRSPAPDDPALYPPDHYVAMFEEIRQRLGAERWLLCGQSFGASLSLRYALMHPERVIAQVFTNSNSALADAETVKGYRETARARGRLAERFGLAGLEMIPVHPVHGSRLPREVRREMLRDAALHKPKAFALTFQHTSPHISLRERMAKNQVPTLLVCGERETKFLPICDHVLAEVPNCEVVGAEAGHAVNIQAAETFLGAVSDFFARHLGEAAEPAPAHAHANTG